LHLDTTLRILLRTGAAPLNFYQYSNPQLDGLMDEVVRAPDTQQMNAIYEQCSKIVIDEVVWIPMCLPPNSTIMHKGLSGISFYPQIFWPPAPR
jgi:peptide/nickel transport system substrate-binding protein